jgi:glycosyltransferase involved in cell wall biosynthesis
MSERPSGVSVVLATRDRPSLLRGAVASAIESLRSSDELIVVDSASRDPATERVGAGAGARVIRVELPGTSRARNAGWRAAHSSVVAFTDDDCEVPTDWTVRIESAFADPKVGFVTGRVLGDREASIASAAVVGEEPKRFDGPSDPAGFGSGANMAFRKEALLAIGGFDEGMGPGTPLRAAEDHDAFWRVLRSGWVGCYDPSIVVTHRLWRTRGGSIRREYAYGVGAGALAVKLIRDHDPGAWRLLRRRLWSEGFAGAARHLVKGYESGAAGASLKAVGVLVGSIRASTRRLQLGLFAPPGADAPDDAAPPRD